MKFNHNGINYVIEFERTTKERPSHVQPKGKGAAPRLAVMTTARLYRVISPAKDDRTLVREYTVTHNHRDRFSLEGGRKAALTMALYDAQTKGGGKALMGEQLSKEFRTVVWNAYHSRGTNTDVHTTPVSVH